MRSLSAYYFRTVEVGPAIICIYPCIIYLHLTIALIFIVACPVRGCRHNRPDGKARRRDL